jgi:spore coat polysaccharide biosynthesis protein SpsF
MLAIIHARMSSNRLPGKVLMPLGEKTILEIIYDRVSMASTISKIVVATSIETSDDPIAFFCQKKKLNCFRGSLDDLQSRMFETLKFYGEQSFVRICGDSPFIDPSLIDLASNLYDQGNFDVVTNTQIRSFPKGQSIEVISKNLMEPGKFNDLPDWSCEHLCQGVYSNYMQFSILNFSSGFDLGDHQMSIDTELDYTNAQKIFHSSSSVPLNWYEAFNLLAGKS